VRRAVDALGVRARGVRARGLRALGLRARGVRARGVRALGVRLLALRVLGLRVLALRVLALRVLGVAVALAAVLSAPAAASTTEPIFGAPSLIDARAPFPETLLSEISCGSPTRCVVAGSKVTLYTTDAGTSAPPTWSQPQVITQAGLSSVSCPTSTLCVTADTDGTVQRSTDGGVTWSSPIVVYGAPLKRVSCADAAVCVASASNGMLFRSTDGGQTWSGPENINVISPFDALSCISGGTCVGLPAGSNIVRVTHDVSGAGTPTWTSTHLPSGLGYLADVSCTGNGVCVVVDSLGTAFISNDVRAPSPTWSPVLIDGTGDLKMGFVSLYAVACAQRADQPGADVCVAADSLGSTTISTNVGAVTPSTWSVIPTFDTGLIQPSDGNPVSPLTALACVGSGWCVAANFIADVAYTSVPIDNPAATVWSTPPVGFMGHDQMSAVSCAPNGVLCGAIDTTGHAVTSVDGGTSWSAATIVAPIGSAFNAISCVSAGTCVASFGDSLLVSVPTAAGATWKTVAADRTGVVIQGVSCTADDLCVAVDNVGGSLISTDRGATWGFVATGDPATLTSVSCPVSTSCVAVDDRGRVVISSNAASDAPTWSAPVAIDGPGGGGDAITLTSVSCTSHAVCVAVDRFGRALISTDAGAHWSAPAAVVPGSGLALRNVSCAGSGLCVAIDSAGSALFSTTPAAADPGWRLATTNTAVLEAISCVGTGLCVGVDAVGNAVVGRSHVALVGLSGVSGTFADTLLGTSSAPQTLTVTNTGDAPLNVAGATLAGDDGGQFALAHDACAGAQLAPGATCSVDVAFAPASSASFDAAQLRVATDAASSPDAIALHGTGVLGPVASLSGGPTAFGTTKVGTVAGPATVVVTNAGQSPMHVSSPTLTGGDAAQFRLVGDSCAGAAVAPGAACAVAVTYAPTAPGTHSDARLVIATDAQAAPLTVSLSGTAIAAAVAPATAAFVSVKAGAKGAITVKLKLPAAGRFSLSTSTSIPAKASKGKRKKTTKITFSSAIRALVKGPTMATVKLTPTRSAAAALAQRKKLRVTLTLAYQATGGPRHTTTSAVTARQR
jgi:hypothetical protein